MCLTYNRQESQEYRKKNPKGIVTIWKVVMLLDEISDQHFETLYQHQIIKVGDIISARAKLSIKPSLMMDRQDIYGEGVHAYITSRLAREIEGAWESHETKRLVKCEASMSDFIGCGKHGDICFKKLKIVKIYPGRNRKGR
jgi:hypothetical protein